MGRDGRIVTGRRGGGTGVPVRAYRAELLTRFAGGEYEAFVAAGARPLRPRLARALALADLRPGLVVLDLGSGRGEAAAHAARRGARVIAMDASLDGLGLVGRTARAAGSRADRLAGDAARLPLADGSVDRVLLLDVIEHIVSPGDRAMLFEVGRILRPGGYVVIHTLPNRWALAFGYRLLRLWQRELPAEPRSDYERLVHVNEQDPLRLRRALSGAGLSCRVWVEEWTTRHAVRAGGSTYPDAARSVGYPLLRAEGIRRAAGWAMASPLRWLVANDIFALAWRPGEPPPPEGGRFRPVGSLRIR